MNVQFSLKVAPLTFLPFQKSYKNYLQTGTLTVLKMLQSHEVARLQARNPVSLPQFGNRKKTTMELQIFTRVHCSKSSILWNVFPSSKSSSKEQVCNKISGLTYLNYVNQHFFFCISAFLLWTLWHNNFHTNKV